MVEDKGLINHVLWDYLKFIKNIEEQSLHIFLPFCLALKKKKYSLLLALLPPEDQRDVCVKEKCEINFKMWILELIGYFLCFFHNKSHYFQLFGFTIIIFSYYSIVWNQWVEEVNLFFISCVNNIFGDMSSKDFLWWP